MRTRHLDWTCDGKSFRSTRVAVIVIGIAAALPSQDWLQVGGTSPLGRVFSAMAYDPGRDRAVMFGGQALGSFLPADTWEWNGSAWQLLNPASPPLPRQGHAFAFDSVGNVVVMFGGLATTGLQNDTWSWSGSWQLLAPPSRPTVRYFHALASDPLRSRIVLFGGFGSSALGDTWEWDGSTWSLRATAGPPARYRHAMAFDASSQRVLLFGGTNMTNEFGDTWAWDGTAWSQLLPVQSPSPRDGHTMLADVHRGVVMSFGYSGGQEQADTWIWNAGAWTLTTGTAPPPRQGHSAAYDSRRGSGLVFSGAFVGVPRSDTWRLPIASVNVYGTGCGTPPLAVDAAGSSLPFLGTTFPTTTSNVPASAVAAYFSLGLSRQNLGALPLPLDLGPFGMPGCWLQHDFVVPFLPSLLGAGTASQSLGIPNQPSLVGASVFLQAGALVPGVNPTWLITSNGLQIVLGG